MLLDCTQVLVVRALGVELRRRLQSHTLLVPEERDYLAVSDQRGGGQPQRLLDPRI